MYESFYNLKRPPFDLTPNPEFVYATSRHIEALSSMSYGLRQHQAFVVVTGEVGIGKTLLVRCLLGQFKNTLDLAYVYVSSPRLTPIEFLQYVLASFGLPAFDKNKGEVLFLLNHFLICSACSNQTCVLIVDEAHNLANEVLEEIRLLTNWETPEDKLLQVVLVGQPELDEKLDSVGLRQLKQRVALRIHLTTLDRLETEKYIRHRLQLAGLSPSSGMPFSDQAMQTIYDLSAGTPRLINTICENSLIAGYGKGLQVVDVDVVQRIARDLGLEMGNGISKIRGAADCNSEIT